MKRQPWLAPFSILSLTSGLYMIFVMLVPGFNEYMKERLLAERLDIIALLWAASAVACPVLLLWICGKIDEKENEEPN